MGLVHSLSAPSLGAAAWHVERAVELTLVAVESFVVVQPPHISELLRLEVIRSAQPDAGICLLKLSADLPATLASDSGPILSHTQCSGSGKG